MINLKFQIECFVNEKNKGFTDGSIFIDYTEKDINIFYRKVALLHSEISELVESMRQGSLFKQCDKAIGLTNVQEELADIQIRLLTLAGFMGVDLPKVTKIKHEFNKSRPYKHGKNS